MMEIIECHGFNKDEAFKDLKFNPFSVQGSNRTRSWRKAGSPTIGTVEFTEWAEREVTKYTKNQPGTGLYIVIKPGVPDIRLRPCKIINNKTKGISTWHIEYWIREDELEVQDKQVSVKYAGSIIAQFKHKRDAIEYTKNLTLQTHKDYSFLRVRVPDINFVSGFSIYRPAAGAKLGTYIAFGYEG